MTDWAVVPQCAPVPLLLPDCTSGLPALSLTTRRFPSSRNSGIAILGILGNGPLVEVNFATMSNEPQERLPVIPKSVLVLSWVTVTAIGKPIVNAKADAFRPIKH